MIALKNYEQLGWTLINDHVNYSLAKNSLERSSPEVAINYLLKLLAQSESSHSQQRSYLGEFLRVFQQLDPENTKFLDEVIQKITIPLISAPVTHILHQQNLLASDQEVDRKNWESITNDLYAFVSKDKHDVQAELGSSSRCAVGGINN